jgi:TPR repeat protein
MKLARPLLLAIGLALLSPLPAAALAPEPASTEELVMTSAGFLSYHPDLRFRLLGLGEYRKGNYAEAMTFFRRAARYADKPSQGMIAEMLWKGQGTAVDRPAAYVWMDLAAERAYKMMLVQREKYWAELTEAERTRALEIGDALHAEYADSAARPRLDQKLRQGKRRVTGSRTGFVGNLKISIPGPNGSRNIDGSAFFDRKFWNTNEYLRMQDGDWKEFGEGTVEIGELQSTGELTVPTDASDEVEPAAGTEAGDGSPR